MHGWIFVDWLDGGFAIENPALGRLSLVPGLGYALLHIALTVAVPIMIISA